MKSKFVEIAFITFAYLVVGYVLVNSTIFLSENAILNNKSLHSAKVLIFNRIPKCGSSTMSDLLRRLALRNNFNIHKSNVHSMEVLKESGIKSFIIWIFSALFRSQNQDTVLVKHQHYVPIPEVLQENVVYINLMRDPVKRFVSGYYYKRKRYQYYTDAKLITIKPDHLEKLYGEIKHEWLHKNIHVCRDIDQLNNKLGPNLGLECENNTMYIISDTEKVQQLKNISRKWFNKSLKSCVANKLDRECNDFSENRPRKTAWRDVMVKHLAGQENLLKNDTLIYPPFVYQSAVPYFCGTDTFCPSGESYKASSQAIRNINEKFEVVGVTENMEMSIRVLESKIPRFFTGASEEYKRMMQEGHAGNNKGHYGPPTEKIIKTLQKHLQGEYEVYNHVVKRLQQQYDEIASPPN